jgi:hypothetical protein
VSATKDTVYDLRGKPDFESDSIIGQVLYNMYSFFSITLNYTNISFVPEFLLFYSVRIGFIMDRLIFLLNVNVSANCQNCMTSSEPEQIANFLPMTVNTCLTARLQD